VAKRSIRDVVSCYEDFNSRPPGRTEIWLRGLPFPVQLRNGTSDFAVFSQVFLMRQYDLPIVLRARSIVDAGANIGMASLYFLWRNPHARVIAIEPDAENHAIAQENLAHFGDRCRLIHGALWSHSSTLAVSRGTYRDGRHWASQTVPISQSTTEQVRAYTVDEIIGEAGYTEVDLLKIDIEGAELQVFRDGNLDFLERTRCCAVECHGAEAESAFRAAVIAHGFTTAPHAELTVATRA
jgi:FkbM family methyltransferase